MTDKTNHIYEDTFKVDIKYTYDRKHNKVYDIDSAVKEFNMLMDICYKAKDQWGNSFTYTLIESKDI